MGVRWRLGSFCVSATLLIGLNAGWWVAPVTAEETNEATVIINEVAWAGSSTSSQDEWVELKNVTDTEIDLTGWQLTKDTSGNGSGESVMITIEESFEDPTANTVVAGGYFLIANNEPEHDFGDGKLSVLNVEPNYISSSVTLSNSSLRLGLYDGAWDGDGQLVDVAGNGGAPLAGSNSAKTSMERNAEIEDGAVAESWHEATVALNLDDDVIDKGTPLSDNSVGALPAPQIHSVVPTTSESDVAFEIEEIAGENFVVEGTTQVQLQAGSSTITATDVHVASSIIIDTANFSSVSAGEWDLVVINPDGQQAVLPNAITITEPEPEEEDEEYSSAIRISELYPRPDTSSNDEFIELHNTSNNSVNLNGWRLDDQHPGGSSEHIITDDVVVTAGGYVTFDKQQTHISLNDSGDYVRLLQPDGNVLDTTPNYGSAPKGKSYALIDNSWQWTARVTPTQANILEVDDEPDENEPNEIEDVELTLSADDPTDDSVMLLWSSSATGTISALGIYQSDDEEELGRKVATVMVGGSEHEIGGLDPETTYFFTLRGRYQGQTIASNQVEVTTTAEVVDNVGQPGQILISELLPNPAGGDDEYIELYNPTDDPVEIGGWKLADASGRTYVINALDLPPIAIAAVGSVVVPSNQYVLLEQSVTGIHLNNSGGEELYLLDTDDKIIDSVSYDGSAKKGLAYVLAPNGSWWWSAELTPGEANDISFAGFDGESGDYLTASGLTDGVLVSGVVGLALTGIAWVILKRREEDIHNQESG